MIKIIRAILKTLTGTVYRTFTADGRPDELIGGKLVQHYGFSSSPPVGTELVTLQMGNNNFAVAENDGSIKPDLDEGDTALYSIGSGENFIGMLIQKEGNAINMMTTDGTIAITAMSDTMGTQIDIESDTVNITSDGDGNVNITTDSGAVRINSGNISFEGAVAIDGSLNVNSGALTVD